MRILFKAQAGVLYQTDIKARQPALVIKFVTYMITLLLLPILL
jgi:hypothetical protein